MPMKYSFLVFMIICLICGGCSKSDSFMSSPHSSTGNPRNPPLPNLPPATQCGANTFGCLVNGHEWLPQGTYTQPYVSCNFVKGKLTLQANQISVFGTQNIAINLTNVHSAGSHVLNPRLSGQQVYYLMYNKKYNCDSVTVGNLTVTRLDSIGHILSGTFYFDAVDSTLRYKIRSGRFDLRY